MFKSVTDKFKKKTKVQLKQQFKYSMIDNKLARAAILKTNFPIGYDKIDYDSNYKDSFAQQYNIRQIAKDNFEKSNNYNNKTSFKINQLYEDKNHFQSIQQMNYQYHQSTPPKLNKEQISQIADSHFSFDAKVSNRHVSENKHHYQAFPIDKTGMEVNKKLRTFLSKHSKIFDDVKQDHQTVNNQFQGNITNERTLEQKKDNLLVNNQISKEVRKSSVFLGFKDTNQRYDQFEPKGTESQEIVFGIDHEKKQFINKKIELIQRSPITQNKVNYKLGPYTSDYLTTFQTKQRPFETEGPKTELIQESKKDLLATHFEIGPQQRTFDTENQVSYTDAHKDELLEHKKTKKALPLLYYPKTQIEGLPNYNHYKLSSVKFRDQQPYLTTNQSQYVPKMVDKPILYTQTDNDYQFGNDPKNHVSEARDQFHNKKHYKKDIKRYDASSINFGDESNYKTNNNESYQNWKDAKGATFGTLFNLDSGMINEIKKKHFDFGYLKNNYNTSQQLSLSYSKQQNQAHAQRQVNQSLNQKGSIYLGGDATNYLSHYNSVALK